MEIATFNIAIALGSNLGDRMEALSTALAAIKPFFVVQAMSPLYETPAAYVEDQPAFLNAVVVGSSMLAPEVLLQHLKKVEADMGRKATFRYGPRLIDLDIIFYGAQIYQSETLKLPHPSMQEREFVLRPLADLVPNWKHPVNERTVTEMLAALPQTARRFAGVL